jgi:hypothetical protein
LMTGNLQFIRKYWEWNRSFIRNKVVLF